MIPTDSKKESSPADEHFRFKVAAAREARETLDQALAETRRRIAEAGLDPSVVDEAVDAARRLD